MQGCLFDDCHVGVRVLPFSKLKVGQYTTGIVTSHRLSGYMFRSCARIIISTVYRINQKLKRASFVMRDIVRSRNVQLFDCTYSYSRHICEPG